MKKFSFHRFLLTLRLQLAADWKRQVGFTLVITLIIFMILWFFNWIFNAAIQGNDSQVMIQRGIYGFLKIVMALEILGLAIGYNSAHSMPFMKTKTAHIAHLVLPATTAEKYAVVQTCAFLLSILETLFALIVADLLQYAITGNFSMGDYFAIDWSYLAQAGEMSVNEAPLFSSSIWLAVVSTLLYSAWFTFCATVFRKHPFLFGILVMWGLQQVFGVVIFSASGMMTNFANWVAGQFSGMSDDQMVGQIISLMGWGIAGIILLALIFWFLSYHRMCKAEL